MKKPRVQECMETTTHAVHADDDLYEVVAMLIDESITGAPVVDVDGKVVGMITEADCLRLVSRGTDGDVALGKVGDFMTADVVCVKPEMDIYYVAGRFNASPACRRFAVVDDDDRLIAVVTRKDILKLVHRQLLKTQSVAPPGR